MSSVSCSTLQLCRFDISLAKRFLALREMGETQINLVFALVAGIGVFVMNVLYREMTCLWCLL